MTGQKLFINQVDDAIWLATFSDYDLGYIDLEQLILENYRQIVPKEAVAYVSGT